MTALVPVQLASPHHQPRARRESARAALREVLARHLGVSTERVPLQHTTRGAPVLPGTGLHLSTSHSGDTMLVALADHPIGVDLEVVRPVAPSLASLLGLPPGAPDDRVLAAWTRVEAYWKALGIGIGERPLVDVVARAARPEGWEVRELATAPLGLEGCVASLAMPRSP